MSIEKGDNARARFRVLNIEVDMVSFEEAVESLRRARSVVTPNMDHLATLRRDSAFVDVYRRADLVLCDSRVLALLLKLLFGIRLDAIPGADLFPAACRRHAADPDFRVFLLGGTTEEIAGLAAARLRAGGVRVVGAYSPPLGFEQSRDEFDGIVRLIRASQPTFVGIGVGSPKQEMFMERLLSIFPEVTFVCIGATIDFLSGTKPRSPRILQILHLEWLFRCVVEPRRMVKRYFIRDLPIVWALVQDRIARYRASVHGRSIDGT